MMSIELNTTLVPTSKFSEEQEAYNAIHKILTSPGDASTLPYFDEHGYPNRLLVHPDNVIVATRCISGFFRFRKGNFIEVQMANRIFCNHHDNICGYRAMEGYGSKLICDFKLGRSKINGVLCHYFFDEKGDDISFLIHKNLLERGGYELILKDDSEYIIKKNDIVLDIWPPESDTGLQNEDS